MIFGGVCFKSSLPAIIFGSLAIVSTVILDFKIREFKRQKQEKVDDKPKIVSNGKPGIELQLETDGEEPEEEEEEKLSKDLEDRHVLFVCMRCNYKKTNCGSLIDCKLEHPDNKVIDQDMEELVEPEPKIKSGAKLYQNLIKEHGSPDSPTRKFRKKFEIRPTRCLSTCEQGNSIALQGPSTKFAYQFAKLDHEQPDLCKDILDFSAQYVESKDGYSKNKTRPNALKATVTSRIPPKNHYSNA